jgi:hypothetical protein
LHERLSINLVLDYMKEKERQARLSLMAMEASKLQMRGGGKSENTTTRRRKRVDADKVGHYHC